jgi:hypothetical protein
MPTRDELYTALRNADKAGDAEGARKLATYIQSLPAETSAAPEKSKGDNGIGATLKKAAEGAALGVSDLGNTVLNVASYLPGKLVPAIAQWNRTRNADFDALTEQNKDSTAFKLGRVGGNIAATIPVGGTLAAGMARVPLLAGRAAPLVNAVSSSGFVTGLPAAATVGAKAAQLGIRATGGAITSGVSSALVDPEHTARGALIGAAIPPALMGVGKVAGYGGRVLSSLVEPFTEAGRAAIVGRTLSRFADDPTAIAAAQGGPSITGALPTVAEATGDAGIARLQDALRSVDPQIENLIGGRLAANNAARVNALQGIARTPADREAAVTAVEAKAKDLYGQAFQENVPVTSALQRLVGKPSVQKAEARAIQLAREQGTPFEARLQDMRPRTVYAGMRDLPESSFIVPDNPAPIFAGTRRLPDSSVQEVTQQFSPLTMNPQPVTTTRYVPSGTQDVFVDLPAGVRDLTVPSGRAPTFVDIPPVESVPVRDMHTLKMGMDALLSDPTLGIAGREAAAVMATRNKLLDLLPESYQVARQAHIQMNRPVNQMDIGNRLLQNYSSATKDLAQNPQLRAEAFNRALQDEAKLIKQATGVKGIKRLADVMEPDQLAAVQGIADELSRTAAVARAGNGPGSASAQRLASQNILQQLVGRSMAESTFANTALGKPLNLLYGGVADPKIQKLLANAVLDPETAAALVRQQATAGRSMLERFLENPTFAQPVLRIAPVAAASDH